MPGSRFGFLRRIFSRKTLVRTAIVLATLVALVLIFIAEEN